MISSGDNESLRFDRSLGVQHNGTGVDGSVHGPNQLIDADGMHATYDAAGNLAELTVARGSCSSEMPGCAHRFLYDWDETGQLARARRWDFGEGPVPAFDPNVLPAWDLSYAYGAGGRTRVTTKDALGTQWHTLDVFGTLRLVHDRDERLPRPAQERGGRRNSTTAANGATPGDILPLVAHGEHANVVARVSSGEPSTTDLLAALDAKADEEHADQPLES